MSGLLRREVLIPLVIVLLGGGAYVGRPWAGPDAASRAQQTPAAARPASSTPDGPVADLRLDRLNAGVSETGQIVRNPFRFQERPAPVVKRPPPQPVYTGPPVPTGPPPPPPITLRFIGLIEAPPRTGRVALLSDGRGGLMYGREGDTIEGRYRMLRVGTDSIEMAYVDGRGRQTIRLSGQ